MRPKKVLIVYKKSAYQIYVLEHRNVFFREKETRGASSYVHRFRKSHERHYAILKELQNFLKAKKTRYRAVYRSTKMNYSPYDLVIALGGDGTFLEAARHVKKQPILGINSDPAHSVGSFCAANPRTFKKMLSRLLEGRAPVVRLERIALRLNGKPVGPSALNEVLVCHRNPAAMSRYRIKLGRVQEEHRNSGLWVATAAGSTGAIRSAGGIKLPRDSAKLQYRPRELYRGHGARYRLKGGYFSSPAYLEVASLMREGAVYMDGPHVKIPFRFGDIVKISRSSSPLFVVRGEQPR